MWAADGRIWFETFGDPSHPTLLLVNGLGSQCINYQDDWCRMFAARGVQVVRFDNRDVGLSAEYEEPYTIRDMCDDGFVVLDAIGVQRAHIMGLSMGGMIVQQMAIDHPERVLTMTSAMSTTGEAEYRKSSPRAFELLMAPPATDRESFIASHIAGLHEWGSPAFADEARWRADAERAFDRSFRPKGAGRQLKVMNSAPSRVDGLRSLTVPTLVMHGDADTLIDIIGGRRTAELVPGARLEVIEGMGHDYPPQLWQRWVDLVIDHIEAHREGRAQVAP